ncbi:hypothetical protein BCR36DRAFT_415090 [Piromyces finnis]|uniref:FZ domain-containing protein n=1 Tax=Piromyces finnis TaxID=1754191 RepID=A0A1Y1V050_9FUNG|nr:hypothetical protein BCR36DRAFT_415090 [Piromyces finnis]|eukprot:ORX44332.1 hypothetical protein BCR36DRAFT_415090 [Piromyces finnis]
MNMYYIVILFIVNLAFEVSRAYQVSSDGKILDSVDRDESSIRPLYNLLKIKTKSGKVIPDSLLKYLSCPIGNINCKNENIKLCIKNSEVCQYSDNKEVKYIDNLSLENYCQLIIEICDMIMNYDPPLTDDYIYDYDRYFKCEFGDTMCISSQVSSCHYVLNKCWSFQSINDCQKLMDICSKIENSISESFPISYLYIPIGSIINKKNKEYKTDLNICPKSHLEYIATKDTVIGDYAIKKNKQVVLMIPYITKDKIGFISKTLKYFKGIFHIPNTKFNKFTMLNFFTEIKKQLQTKKSQLSESKNEKKYNLKQAEEKQQLSSRKRRKQKKLSIDQLIYKKQRKRSHVLRKIQQRSNNEYKKYIKKNTFPIGSILEKFILDHIPKRIRHILPKKFPVKRSTIRNIRLYRRILRKIF